jgi:hypothetical protein
VAVACKHDNELRGFLNGVKFIERDRPSATQERLSAMEFDIVVQS